MWGRSLLRVFLEAALHTLPWGLRRGLETHLCVHSNSHIDYVKKTAKTNANTKLSPICPEHYHFNND